MKYIVLLVCLITNILSCRIGYNDCGNGVCLHTPNGIQCHCFPSYITIDPESECNYTQRNLDVGFTYSLFFGGLGADWFYLARGNGIYIFIGLLKLFLSFTVVFLSKLVKIMKSNESNEAFSTHCKVVTYMFTLPLCIVFIFWWILDFVRMGNNTFLDGNGHNLYAFGW